MNAVGPSAIGQSVERADGRLKLSGQAEFTGDLRLPGMLYGAVLHSPVAHARIASIGTAAAEKAGGVAAVLVGDDLSDIDPYYGHALRDRPVVAIGKVRFLGEPVAVVAAESQAAADAAVTLIDVAYDELPIAASLETALAPDAPLVHEKRARPGRAHGLGDLPDADGNTCYSYSFRRGDTGRAFADAAVVVEGEYTFPAVYQYSMETHTTIARWHGGELTLWSSCQHPFLVRQEIAALFGLPLDQVRIIVPFLGGGFGSKSYTKMEPLTAAIARKAGRPVRILNAVHESMITTRRHNMTARMRTAAAAGGPGHRHGRRRRPRPVPLAGPGRGGELRLHQHRPGRLLPRLRRHAPAVDRGVAAGRGGPPAGHRPAGDPPPEPAPPGRRGPPRRQAPGRRPGGRRREGGTCHWMERTARPFGR